MKYKFRLRTEEDVKEFLTWKFEGIYSFYDNDIQKEKIDYYLESVNKENLFSIYDSEDKLIGNCEYEIIDGDFVFGVQLKPELTSKGLGESVIRDIIEYAKNNYNHETLHLGVVKFNERAIRLYTRVGFVVEEEMVWNIRGNDYEAVIMGLRLK